MSAVEDIELPRLILLLLYAVSALAAASHALLHKRDPRSAWGWIAACWLFPMAGALCYYLFGINRLPERARRLAGPLTARAPADKPDSPSPCLPGMDAIGLRELVRIGDAMTDRALSSGNHLDMLHNGDEAYPAMLEAISGARETVYLCTYMFEYGAMGRRLVDALSAAHARGVLVRVLVDGIPDLFFAGRACRRLRANGVATARFLAPRLFPPRLSLNLRNHRKLLLVDGRTAFTGGMNIRDAHMLSPLTAQSTADLHFQIAGPVIEQLERCFLDDWYFAKNEVLPASSTSPVVGNSVCRVITEGPNEDIGRLVMILMGAIGGAHHRVLIMTPYFIPNPELIAALQAAALRGVVVDILLPERSNQRYVDWASKRILEALLHRKVRVWLRPAPFSHAKLFMVDDHYAQIGSANMDQRSLRLNFELMLEIYDWAFVTTLGQHCEAARAASKPLELRTLAARSLFVRLRDAACWLLSPYL